MVGVCENHPLWESLANSCSKDILIIWPFKTTRDPRKVSTGFERILEWESRADVHDHPGA